MKTMSGCERIDRRVSHFEPRTTWKITSSFLFLKDPKRVPPLIYEKANACTILGPQNCTFKITSWPTSRINIQLFLFNDGRLLYLFFLSATWNSPSISCFNRENHLINFFFFRLMYVFGQSMRTLINPTGSEVNDSISL